MSTKHTIERVPPADRASDVAAKRRNRSRRPRKRWVINGPLLVATIVVAVISTTAAYFWHGYQLDRNADALLAQATRYEKANDWTREASFLHRYLKLRPNDADTRIRLAEIFGTRAETAQEKQRATELYLRAVGLARGDKQLALRERLSELYLDRQLNRLSEADEQANALLDIDAKNPTALRVKAIVVARQVELGNATFSEAKEAFDEALKQNPGDVGLASALADLYAEKLDQPASGDDVMDALVMHRKDDVMAYLARYRYRSRRKLDGAESDLQMALKLAPNSWEALVLAGQADAQKGRWAAAISNYEAAARSAPDNALVYKALGAAHIANGDVPKAIGVWQRGANLTNALGQLDLRVLLCNLHLERLELDAARGELTKLDDLLRSLVQRLRAHEDRVQVAVPVAFLRARHEMLRGRYSRAISVLKNMTVGTGQVFSRLTGRGELDDEVWRSVYLGDAYTALKQWDMAERAYGEAASKAPDVPELLLNAAKASEMAGRLSRAVNQYSVAVSLDKAPPEAWVSLAQARFKRAIQLTGKAREAQWRLFESELAAAREHAGNSPKLMMLDAQAAANIGHGDEAVALLDEAVSQAAGDDVAELLPTATLLYELLGHGEKAEAAVRRIEELGQSTAVAAMAKAGLYTLRKDYDAARSTLTEGLKHASAAEAISLEYRLAGVQSRAGNVEASRKLLRQLAEKDPPHLQVLVDLAELAATSGDTRELQWCVARIEQAEGSSGTLWRYLRCSYLLTESENTSDDSFLKACSLHEELQTLRPTWPAVFFLTGRIAEARDDDEQAADAYQRAIDYGDTSVATMERLVSVRSRQGRLADVQPYLQKYQGYAARSAMLSAVGIRGHIEQGDIDAASALAKHAANLRPQDPLSHIWLGMVLMLDGDESKREAAETAFLTAVDLDANGVRGWEALISFYALTNQADKARQQLARLETNEDVDPTQRSFVLGQGYELIGDRPAAERFLLEAQRLAPDNVAIQGRLARFYLRSDAAKARLAYRRLLEIDPESRTAMRSLATLLAASNEPDAWNEAEHLLEANTPPSGFEAEDRRLQALILLRRGGSENLGKARKRLETIADSEEPTPGDRLLLANIHESEGDLESANEQLLQLVDVEEPSPAYLETYIAFLLRHPESNQNSERWLSRLDEVEPDGFRRVVLRARWLESLNRAGEIDALVDDYVKHLPSTAKDTEQANRWMQAGDLFASLELHSQAEKAYRRLAELNPDGYLKLVVWLLQRERVAEAVRFCLSKTKAGMDANAAILLANGLLRDIRRESGLSQDEFRQAESALREAVNQFGGNTRLLFDVGTLHYLRGDSDEAQRFYRRVLDVEREHVGTLNNLAVLLAEQNAQNPEPVDLINRAIAVGGESAELLDSKALIMILQHKAAFALPILNSIVSKADTVSRYRFHLAVAQQQTGALEDAAASLATAVEHGLSNELLTPRERQSLAELQSQLALGRNEVLAPSASQ